jgi:DNA-binding NarL/FixJ family response regulator
MIKKVLIAEDHESANISLQKTLGELGIEDIHYVYYCDDALTKIQGSKKNNESYDLLITDLSFEEDGNRQKISDGAALISAALKVQPDLKILIFSAENKAAIITAFFNNLSIDGYVRKARNDAKDLKLAIERISEDRRYFPRHLMQKISSENDYPFNDIEKAIIMALAQGKRQKDIPLYLKERQMHPTSLSSIEKRLNHIKVALDFSKNEQLVAHCKDKGII